MRQSLRSKDKISWIRTRAIEIVNVFEMEFRWLKDMLNYYGIIERRRLKTKTRLILFSGMTYELLKRKEKRIINRSDTPGSSVTLIESKILSMLQSDYLSLVAAFQ